MLSSKTLDLLGAAFFLAQGVALTLIAARLEVGGGNWMVDRGFWPKWIGILMIGASLVMALQAWRANSQTVQFLPKRATWLLLASIALFFIALPWLGYVFGSLLWLVAVGLIAGERSPVRLAVFSLAAVSLGYLVFWNVLSVPLPVGALDRMIGLDGLIYR